MASRELQVVITGDASQIRRVLGDLGGDLDRVGGNADQAASRWSRVGSAVAVGAGAAGVALAGFAAAAVTTGAEFERQMSAVAAVSGATEDQLDTLSQKALQLGRDTVFGATEAAGAMEELVKAGLSVDEVLNGAADATVSLAAAGGIDLANAATIASNALNAFNLEASDMVGIADTIAGAANTSAIDVAEFGMSMQQASAVANLVGLSFEDTATAVGLLGDAGIRGSDAGTSLKTMLTRLTPQTVDQARAMERLGLMTEEGTSKFYDQTGSLRSLDEIAQILQDTLRGMTSEQAQQALYDIFGSDALRAGAVLFGEGADGVRAFSEAMGEMTAAEVAEERLDNLMGSVERLKGAVESFLIEGSGPLNTALRGLVDSGTAAVEWMSAPPEGLVEWASSTADAIEDGVAPALEDLVDAGENLWDLAVGLARDLQPVGEAIAGLGGAAAAEGLQLVARGVEETTEVLVDHRQILVAVAAGYAGVKAAQIGAGVWTAAAAAVGTLTTAYQTMGTTLSLIAWQSHMTRIQVVAAMTATSISNVVNMAVSAQAIAAGAVAGIAVGASLGFMTLQRNADNARRAHEELMEAIDANYESNDIRSLNDDVQALMSEYQALEDMASKSDWEQLWQNVNPFVDNEIDDARHGQDAIAKEIDKFTEKVLTIADVMREAGVGQDEFGRWAETLNLDPATMSVEEMVDAIREAKVIADQGDPAVQQLAESMGVMADETSTAADELNAWKEAFDAIIGVQVSFEQAQLNLHDALAEFATSARDAALAGEEWSGNLFAADEASRQTRHQVADLVDEALNMATAFYEAGGGLDGATWKLAEAREQIIQAGEAAGISRDDMIAYLDTLGLTPENITTQLDLTGEEAVEAAINVTTRPRTVDVALGIDYGSVDAAERALADVTRPRSVDVSLNYTGGGPTYGSVDAADRWNRGAVVPGRKSVAEMPGMPKGRSVAAPTQGNDFGPMAKALGDELGRILRAPDLNGKIAAESLR